MRNNKKYRNRKHRSGFSIVETGIVLVVTGVFVLGLYAAYSKLYLPFIADNEYQKIAAVISGVERVRLQNKNAFLESGEKPISEPSLAKLQNAMGGENSYKDVRDWTYECAHGAGSTIKVVTSDYDAQVVRDILIDYINTHNAPWIASVGASLNVIMIRP